MATARLRSVTAAWREVRSAAAVRTVASSRSFDQGLETKSVAPRFIASTAIWTPPWAVIITTTACGIALQYLAEPVEAFGGVGRAAAEIGVEQDDVGAVALDRRQRLLRGLEGGDLLEQVAQQQPRGQQDVRIVVDDDAAPERLPLPSHGVLLQPVRKRTNNFRASAVRERTDASGDGLAAFGSGRAAGRAIAESAGNPRISALGTAHAEEWRQGKFPGRMKMRKFETWLAACSGSRSRCCC